MSISIKNLRGNTEESALTAHTSALHMLQTLLLSEVAEVQETDVGGAPAIMDNFRKSLLIRLFDESFWMN